MAGELVSLSDPVDVAEELQVGSVAAPSSVLEFDQQVQRGGTIKNTDTIKAGLKTKIELKGKVKGVDLEGTAEAELKAEASFENETISENTLGSKTGSRCMCRRIFRFSVRIACVPRSVSRPAAPCRFPTR